MLVEFIGAPCSGKTTTAAQLFGQLKDLGHACEFITERARGYIAELLLKKICSQDDSPVALVDFDQVAIMEAQLDAELNMELAVGRSSLVITDSSPLNSLLYMSPDCRVQQSHFVASLQPMIGVTFVCRPVDRPVVQDANRVHTVEQSRAVDKEIDALVAQHCRGKVIELIGPTHHRLAVALRHTFNAWMP